MIKIKTDFFSVSGYIKVIHKILCEKFRATWSFDIYAS